MSSRPSTARLVPWLLACCWASCAAGTRHAGRPPPAPAAARAAPVAEEAPVLSSEATYHYLRGTLLLGQGDAEGAVAALREALVFDHASAGRVPGVDEHQRRGRVVQFQQAGGFLA